MVLGTAEHSSVDHSWMHGPSGNMYVNVCVCVCRMRVCMYVCMFVSVYVCMYVRAYVRMCVRSSSNVMQCNVFTYLYLGLCMHVCMRIHVVRTRTTVLAC